MKDLFEVKPGEGRLPQGPMIFFGILITAIIIGCVLGIMKLIFKFLIWVF